MKKIDASDRNYFIHHRDQTGNVFHISQPHYSKVTGERVIYLTSRLESKPGVFCGVIGIQLKLSHFDSMYRLLKLPPGGTVTLLRGDGEGIYRYPLVDRFFDQSVADNSAFRDMMARGSGSIINVQSPYDELQRIVGYRTSDRYPLLNLISISHHSALEHWQQQAIRTLLLASLGGIALLLLAFFTYRQLEHLSNAINLSTHDPLTNIHNRRAFDERLDQEWRRAARREGELSILYIDIDHFKMYNDQYGHSVGDDCLKKVAACLSSCAKRSGEMVARYGGEEFIVLLPDCDHQQALAAADNMRTKVMALNIPHGPSPIADHITISIGVSSTTVRRQTPVDQLIRRADNALYQAKLDGRNLVRSYDTNTC